MPDGTGQSKNNDYHREISTSWSVAITTPAKKFQRQLDICRLILKHNKPKKSMVVTTQSKTYSCHRVCLLDKHRLIPYRVSPNNVNIIAASDVRWSQSSPITIIVFYHPVKLMFHREQVFP